jgi:hypothetical protein
MKCEKCNIEIDNDSVLDLCNCCFEKYINELNILYYEGRKDMRHKEKIKKCTVVDKLNGYSKDTLIEYIILEGFINFGELDRINEELKQQQEKGKEDKEIIEKMLGGEEV